MKKKLWFNYSLYGLLSALLLALDLWTKWWIVALAQGKIGGGVSVIKGILKFSYVENTGASMGILGGHKILLILLTVLILGLGVWYFIKNKPTHPLVLTASALILSGAVGNLIDRVMLGYVRDFISFSFFPYTFNVADCGICIGAGLLVLYAFLNVKE